MKILLRALLFCTLAAVASAAVTWTEDYDAAVAQAKAEQKKLLLNFTGSDWCGWCHKIDAEVFTTPEFEAYAAKNLVLVKVDFPKKRELPIDTKQQNAKLKKKFKVQGYPTLVVLTADEKTHFTQGGYAPGGPQAFIAAVEKGAKSK